MKKPIEQFIPAKALQHPHNPELSNLKDRIRLAMVRIYEHKDFFSELPLSVPPRTVYLEAVVFNPTDLGYDIWGSIESG